MLTRLFSLLSGKIRRWVKARESRDPEAVYESAIAERVRRYHALKSAAAGVIYMRNKLERELKSKTGEYEETAVQAVQAADMDEDQCALILIRRKQELEAECARLKEDLSQLTVEAEDAKKNLIGFKTEIDKLKVEKVRMMARLRNAQARVRIQHALEDLSYDEDVRALEEVRESIQQMLAQAGVIRELHSAEVEEKLAGIRNRAAETRAEAELAEIKRRRRGLVPMEVITQNGAANGSTTH